MGFVASPFRITQEAVGGSLHCDMDPTQIADTQYQALLNLYQFGTGDSQELRCRPGISKITSVAYSERITGLHNYTDSSGNWTLIVLGLTSLSKYSGGAYTGITSGSGLTTSDLPWRVVQYRDMMYASRGNATLKKFKPTTAYASTGIAAPAFTATLGSSVGAGSLATGTYKYVFTYVDENTDNESDYGPVHSVTHASAKDTTMTGITDSADPYVTHKYIYRSFKDSSGVYYYAGKVAQGTTTFTDSTLETALGDSAPSPGSGGQYTGTVIDHTVWRQKMFVTGGTVVNFSQDGRVEMFDPLDELSDFNPNDGAQIVGLLGTKDRLWVAKTNSMWIVTGTDSTDFQIDHVSLRIGCVAGKTLAELDRGTVIWLGHDDVYISRNGGDPEPVGSSLVRTLFQLKPSLYSRCHATVDPKRTLYLLSMYADTNDQYVLAYNYVLGVWSYHKYTVGGLAASAPACYGTFYDSTGSRVLYGAFTDNNYVYNVVNNDTNDDGTDIPYYFQTKQFGSPDYPGYDVIVRRIRVRQAVAPATDHTVTVYRQDGTSTTSLLYDNGKTGWIANTAISTHAQGSPSASLKVSGSATYPYQIRISGWGLDGATLPRTSQLYAS